MLVIRLQRTGRKGHAMFRLVVQDSRRTPTSGKIAALLGHYDPHSKAITLDKEKTVFYLSHGAQPSPTVSHLLKSQGIKLPSWVSLPPKKKSAIRQPEKLRRNRPSGAETSTDQPIAPDTTAEPVEKLNPVGIATDPTETSNVTEQPAESA